MNCNCAFELKTECYVPSGKRLHNELERSTIFNGKTHYFDWAIFNSYVTNYQRVIGKNVFVLYLYLFELAMLVGGSGSTLVVACNPGGATSPISSIPFQTAILLFVSGIV